MLISVQCFMTGFKAFASLRVLFITLLELMQLKLFRPVLCGEKLFKNSAAAHFLLYPDKPCDIINFAYVK